MKKFKAIARTLFVTYLTLSVLFLVWIAVSFVDVNLHNTLGRDGKPQGGTQWEHNAFVMLVDSLQDK